MVTEKAIIFDGESVRAILRGRKTQTRRVVKPQPQPFAGGVHPEQSGAHSRDHCVDIDAVSFEPTDSGLHQGADASSFNPSGGGTEQGPFHGTCPVE